MKRFDMASRWPALARNLGAGGIGCDQQRRGDGCASGPSRRASLRRGW